MKRIRTYFSTNSVFQAKWLRSGLICGLIIIVGIFNYGCNEEDSYKKADEYYVKYIIESSTIYSGGKLNVTIDTEVYESMGMAINQNEQWEVIIGPVSKGFHAKLMAVAPSATNNELRLHSEIHTSKNDSPFAMKVINDSDTPRNSVELNYTIDY